MKDAEPGTGHTRSEVHVSDSRRVNEFRDSCFSGIPAPTVMSTRRSGRHEGPRGIGKRRDEVGTESEGVTGGFQGGGQGKDTVGGASRGGASVAERGR